MRRWLVLLAPAVLAGAFLLWMRGEARAPSREATMPAGRAPAIRWERGAHQAYAVKTEAVLKMGLPGAPAPVHMEARLSGVLDVQVVEAEGARGRFRLAPALYGAAGGPDRAAEIGLSTTFEVAFDVHGRPIRFDFPPALPAEGRFVLEQLIRTFQVVTGDGASWAANEENATGRYVAAYRVAVDGTIVKEKRAFEEVTAQILGVEGPLDVRLPRSEALVRISPTASWVESVKLSEEMTVFARGEQVMESRLEASLTRLASVPDPPPELPLTTARSRIADPEAELSRLLVAIESTDGTDVRAVHGVRDLLTACPETAASVRAAIARGEVGDRPTAFLINALQLAGTPEAQAALGSIVEGEDMSRTNRLRAAIALGGVTAPTSGAIESLWRVSLERADGDPEERADTALLALGALAPAARGDETIGQVEEGLVARLRGTTDPDETGILLGALGNARNPALVPAVARYLDDPSAYVRSSAADALGNMTDGPAETLLVERLRNETDPRVRTALAASLNRVTDPSRASLEAVLTMVAGEETDGSRLEMARFLGEQVEKIPEARPVLEKMLQKERSRRVRSYLATFAPKDAATH